MIDIVVFIENDDSGYDICEVGRDGGHGNDPGEDSEPA